MQILVPISARTADSEAPLVGCTSVEIQEVTGGRLVARHRRSGTLYREHQGRLWRALHLSSHETMTDDETPFVRASDLEQFSHLTSQGFRYARRHGLTAGTLQPVHAINRHLHRNNATGQAFLGRQPVLAPDDDPGIGAAVAEALNSTGRLRMIDGVLHAPTFGPGFTIQRTFALHPTYSVRLVPDRGNSWPGSFHGLEDGRKVIASLRQRYPDADLPDLDLLFADLEIEPGGMLDVAGRFDAEIETAAWWMVKSMSRTELRAMTRDAIADYKILLDTLRSRAATLGVDAGSTLMDPLDSADTVRADATPLRYVMRRLLEPYRRTAVPLRAGDVLELFFEHGGMHVSNDPDPFTGFTI